MSSGRLCLKFSGCLKYKPSLNIGHVKNVLMFIFYRFWLKRVDPFIVVHVTIPLEKISTRQKLCRSF